MTNFWSSFRMFLLMTFLTGILYPFIITFIAQTTMPEQANGSFLTINDKKIGSKLIAQKFESDKYFWPRPSSIDYNPLPSGGSNLGPTSSALKKAVEERKQKIMKAHNLTQPNEIPAELLFSSGSGLDPHISLKAAFFQLDRIVKARGLNEQEKMKLTLIIKQLNTGIQFLNKHHINVLELNLALDNLKK